MSHIPGAKATRDCHAAGRGGRASHALSFSGQEPELTRKPPFTLYLHFYTSSTPAPRPQAGPLVSLVLH